MQIQKKQVLVWAALITLLASFGTGAFHLFDWDEINFAESSREMLQTGNFSRVQINFRPFWEKPPLFFWIQSACMKLFGVNEWAARMPNALVAGAAFLYLFYQGKKIANANFGFLWAFVFSLSLLPFFYAKSGIIDPLFNILIFASFITLLKASLIESVKEKRLKIILAGFLNGFAILAKGPVALLLVAAAYFVYWASNRFSKLLSFFDLIIFGTSCLLTACIWFLPELITNGPWFFEEFFRYQVRLFSTPDAGHSQPWFYHPLVILIGCFPMSLYAFKGILSSKSETNSMFKRWNLSLFWVVLILFSVVKTKIIHYSSLCYLPLSFVAADYLWAIIQQKKSNVFIKYATLFVGLILGIGIFSIQLIDSYIKSTADSIENIFAKAQTLAIVGYTSIDFVPGIILLTGVIISFIFFSRLENFKAVLTLGFGLAFSLNVLSITTLPKIENYSQGSYIRFLEKQANKDVYVDVIGFKSYAHFYYTQKKGLSSMEKTFADAETTRTWFLTGDIDKPVIFVTRNSDYPEFENIPGLFKIGEENGYIFLQRNPK